MQTDFEPQSFYIFLGSEYDLPALLSLWITLDESASLIQPLRGPLLASSVSMTLFLSFLVMGSSSMAFEFLLSESSSSSPLRNLDLNLDLPVVSSSSSSPPYRLIFDLLLLLSKPYPDLSPNALLLVGGEVFSS